MKWLLYVVLRRMVRFAQLIYFRRIEVLGREHIPKQGAVIFAVRHPNALMDPLMVSAFAPRRMNFLVRADVFSGGLVSWLLGLLNMLPIYRQRDGKGAVDRNHAIFARCA
ncbi:MAG: 1-acyl-sn-glycerol-3-phosphate acyltransferase, partial [Bacteroidota bacterium]